MAFWTRQHRAFPPASDARIVSLVVDGRETAARLIEIDGAGALLATALRPPLGRTVTIRHARGGLCPAEVAACEIGGLRLSLPRSQQTMGFVLAVLASDAAGRRRDAA